ncbi:imidazole glycerol phosphate synthase subunit HisH [Candidatus Gottesmanbacteria bacterium]|nr:imidazole glycerol phosphate synthase subunit HisH [Candidatus Gottesmanbacteria bacterium]
MIAILDYKIGNVGSVRNAFDKLNFPSVVTNNPDIIHKADALVLPGVGAAGKGMENLKNGKLIKCLKSQIAKKKPFLGICLGMQLLFETSEEGDTKCLAVLKGQVKKFQKEKKIPQIGWNEVRKQITDNRKQNYRKLFWEIPNKSYFYFVNSYYCNPENKSLVVGETEYGENFASIIAKDNIVATQFHPEKSGSVGMKFLKNWRNLW